MTPTLKSLKKPLGTAKRVDLTAVRYLAWQDAFEVDFKHGLTFLEPHSTICKASRISPKAEIERVGKDEEYHEGFFVHYNNGQRAEVSWAFIRELPPKKTQWLLPRGRPARTRKVGPATQTTPWTSAG